MKKLTRMLTIAALSAVAFAPAFAQQPTASPSPAAGQGQESEADAKRRLYTIYYENYANNPATAYTAAQEYIRRFGSTNDQYVAALREFITIHENRMRGEADAAVYRAIAAQQYPEAFRLGRERIAANPDNLKMMINLALAGLRATLAGTNPPAADITADSLNYATRSLQAIQAGRVPAGEGTAAWEPFTTREDTVSWLNYTLGTLNLRTNPTEAANYLRRVAEGNGAAKREPTTYSYLAFVYNTEYERLRQDYQTRFPVGSEETPESVAALAILNSSIDRIMDAYARAITASNTSENQPRYQAQRTEWTTALTGLYRFRNNNSEEGLQAFITGAASRPLPQPGQPPMAMPNQATTTNTTPGTQTPTTTPSTATPSTATPSTTTQPTTAPRTTPTATPSTTTRPATTTPNNTTRPTTTQPATQPTPRPTTTPTPSPRPATRP